MDKDAVGAVAKGANDTINHGIEVLQYLNPEVAQTFIRGGVQIISIACITCLIVVGAWLYLRYIRKEPENKPSTDVAKSDKSAEDNDAHGGIAMRALTHMVDHLISEQGQVLQNLSGSIDRNTEVVEKHEESFREMAALIKGLAEEVKKLKDTNQNLALCPHSGTKVPPRGISHSVDRKDDY